MDINPHNLIRALTMASRLANPNGSVSSWYWNAEIVIDTMGFSPDDLAWIKDELSREKSRDLAMDRDYNR